MASKVEAENKQQQSGSRVIPGVRLYKTRDGRRLVELGHRDAYELFCTEHGAVDRKELAALGGAPESKGDEPEPEPEPESEGGGDAVDELLGDPEPKLGPGPKRKGSKG